MCSMAFLRRWLIKSCFTVTRFWNTSSSQRDESEKTFEDCRTFGRVCLMLVSLFVIWGLLYMPLRVGSRVPPTESLSWMVTQRDLSKYILPDNDTHLLSPKASCNSSVFMAVVVCSSVPNFGARQAVRNSWAQDATKQRNIQVFFLLGKSSNDSLNALVANESQKYMDVIQQDFLDTYNNLTIKSVMLLKWVNQHCSSAKYVMKTDDDMFVNLPNLFRLLKAKGKKRMLLGCLIEGAVPIKDRNSKWFVPDGVFPSKVYPPYLSGTGYVMSQDTVPLLYRTALSTPFFYLEDIFITGVCASRVGLKPVNNDGFKFDKRENDACVFKSLITAHKMTPKELLQMWKSLQNPSIKCKTGSGPICSLSTFLHCLISFAKGII